MIMSNLELILVASLGMTVAVTLYEILFSKKARRYWLRTLVRSLIISVITISALVLANLHVKWQLFLLGTVAVGIGTLIAKFVLNKVWPTQK